MIRMNVDSVVAARDKFKDAHDQKGNATTKAIAVKVLKKSMSSDSTDGAIKWFSPRSMPQKGESCKGYDCSGGLIKVVDTKKVTHEVYAPGFHESMTYVPLGRAWYLRLYKL